MSASFRRPGGPGAERRDEAGPDGDETRRRMAQIVAAMPKAELHLHLDGSLLPETAFELARSRRIEAPATLAGMRAAMVAPPHAGSQAALLASFELPLALLQDSEALEQAAIELVVQKAAEGVRYLEIRWAPSLHTRRGLRLADVLAAVCQGARIGAVQTGCVVRLICTAMRSAEPEHNVAVAREAIRFADEGLTGFDLAGPEEAWPDPATQRRAFEAARAGGLRITLHAGEWGGAAQVWASLGLDPERIAHGQSAIDDPQLCDVLAARAITLDLCPTSEVQAGVVLSLADHPLARLFRRGVPVSLSSDDRTVSGLTLTDEYLRALEHVGLTLPELWAIDCHAFRAAFADESTLAPLRGEFEAWAAAVPELAGTVRGQPLPRSSAALRNSVGARRSPRRRGRPGSSPGLRNREPPPSASR